MSHAVVLEGVHGHGGRKIARHQGAVDLCFPLRLVSDNSPLVLSLIRRGRLAASASGAVVDVLVAGGRIARVAPHIDASIAIPEVDLDGRWLVPGLVDAHVHLTGGGGERGFATRVPRLGIGDFARAGVTSVIGLLGTDGVTRTLRDLVATAYGLREEGLSAWCYTGSYGVPPPTLTGSVKDDIIFVDPILGVGELALSDHRSSQPTLDELLRVASDAYVAGLTAKKAGIVHLHLGDGPRGLDLVRRALEVAEIPARVWQPTHLNRNPTLWAEAKSLAAAPPSGRLPWFDVTAFPASDLDGALSAADAVCDWMASGLPLERLTVSSDGGGCLPSFDADGCMVRMGVGQSTTLMDTVRELVLERGVALGEAMQLVSTSPARAAMLERKGRIDVGMDADLVVLDEALQVDAVMAMGAWLVRGAQLTARGRGVFEAPRGTEGSAAGDSSSASNEANL
ncbi:MAG: beta-aspartyl-peptidase [Myxococcota bacterium]